MARGKRRGGGRGRVGSSKRLKPVIRSAEEIEDGIFSTSSVAWDPFTVLPKEIFLEIFHYLDNPTDKQNFMNAHVKFYELFKAERVKFLFGKVFGDLELTRREMTDKNLTGLRLVCREWDQAIQNYYQLHPHHFVSCDDNWRNDSNQLKNPYANGYSLMLERYRQGQWEGYVTMRTSRYLSTDLDEFLASHPPSRNPFLTRKINICIGNPSNYEAEDEEALETFWSKLDKLFDTYGHHVWHFVFQVCWRLEPRIYSRILRWLRLMPELRTLQMGFGRDPSGEPVVFQYIIQIESPELRKLQNIRVSNFPSCVFNKLLEGMPAVEKVEVGFQPQLQGFQFPTRITELAFRFWEPEDAEGLKTLGEFPLPPKLIIIVNHGVKLDDSDGTQSSWKTLWTAIEEKFPDLEELQLTLPEALQDNIKRQLMEESLDCRLNLKNIKRLSLTSPILFSLDFLQEIKTLQELKIRLNLELRQKRRFKGFDQLVRREREYNSTRTLVKCLSRISGKSFPI